MKGVSYYEYRQRARGPVFVRDPELGYRIAPNLRLKRPNLRGGDSRPRR